MSHLGQFKEVEEVQLFWQEKEQSLAFPPSPGSPPYSVDVLLRGVCDVGGEEGGGWCGW